MARFTLSVILKGGLGRLIESDHPNVDDAIDQLSQVVAMRILKRYRAKISDDVRQFNECTWDHKNFTMSIELVE